ncbi:MAG TPA: hypothetical protein VLO11_03290 [Luteolibacter sp.]|nr:hypothetical protein [Luteolibacter sp.]
MSCEKAGDEVADGPAASRSSQLRESENDDRQDLPVVDLRTALLEAVAMENTTVRHEAVAALAWRAVSEDLAVAREALGHLPADATKQRTPLVRHLAMQLAHEDPEAALAWAESLGGGRETALAEARIALVIADSDPRRAATMLADSGDAGRERDVAIVQVLQHWSASEPAAAADWLTMFPAGNFRKAGMHAVISRWLAADAPTAMGWLGSLQEPELRGEALATAAGVLASHPAETREAWLDAADAATRAAIQDAGGR